jgi:uridine kinase
MHKDFSFRRRQSPPRGQAAPPAEPCNHRVAAYPVVLIGGASGSGKSSMATRFADTFDCALISQDNYFTHGFVPYAERTDDTLEGPSIIDWCKLRADVETARQTGPVVVEGHLVYTDADLVSSAGLVVIIELAKEGCKSRRLHRRQRSAHDLVELDQYFEAIVWPAYLRYGRPAVDRLQNQCSLTRPQLLVLDGSHTPDALDAAVATAYAHLCGARSRVSP